MSSLSRDKGRLKAGTSGGQTQAQRGSGGAGLLWATAASLRTLGGQPQPHPRFLHITDT